MARANSGSTRILSKTPPILTGQSRTDAELWRLSFVLAEIAEQAVRSKNDGGTGTEKQIRHKMSNETVLTPIGDASND